MNERAFRLMAGRVRAVLVVSWAGALGAGALGGGIGTFSGCQPSRGTGGVATPPAAQPEGPGESAGVEPPRVYSPFGEYARLPDWSTWCGLQPDMNKCAEPLQKAVDAQTAQSRPTVREHGFYLWSSIWSPIVADPGRNDALQQRTNLYGTGGCWAQFADGQPACSGIYPLWMTWPNTGKPYGARGALEAPATTDATPAAAPAPTAHSVETAKTLRTKRHAYGTAVVKGEPDPTKSQTVNTDAPTYALPPLVLSKQCGLTPDAAKQLLRDQKYPEIAAACTNAGAPDMFCIPAAGQAPAICDGTAFVNQGDVMIATESLSVEGYDDIQKHALYDKNVLAKMYADHDNTIPEKIGRKFISTKHMFWPVKGCRPGVKIGEPGCRIRYGALPPWVPKDFKKVSYSTNADYLGYERWKSVIAIDTCEGSSPTGACAKGTDATLVLQYVSDARPISTRNPKVYGARDFVHVQISAEALQAQFTATDRALLDQAAIWAYGDESNGFEPGDFLVVAAMHVNTKEIPSWAFQSVWWSPMSDSLADCPLSDVNHCFGQTGGYAATARAGSDEPNPHSGLDREQLLDIDRHVGKAWREHYLMTDSYGINYELDGTKVTASNYFKGVPPAWATVGPSGQPLPLLPISANVYIEPVIHPLGTDCQNCHRRAGYPGQSCASGEYAGGCGRANYQTAQCADLLGDYGAPAEDPCLMTPWAWHTAAGNDCKPTDGTLCKGKEAISVLNTDWIWIIADSHINKR